jgi:hypothetical protein
LNYNFNLSYHRERRFNEREAAISPALFIFHFSLSVPLKGERGSKASTCVLRMWTGKQLEIIPSTSAQLRCLNAERKGFMSLMRFHDSFSCEMSLKEAERSWRFWEGGSLTTLDVISLHRTIRVAWLPSKIDKKPRIPLHHRPPLRVLPPPPSIKLFTLPTVLKRA